MGDKLGPGAKREAPKQEAPKQEAPTKSEATEPDTTDKPSRLLRKGGDA